MRSSTHTLVFSFGLALSLVLVFYNSLGNGFHYDDLHSIVENPHLRQLGNIPAFFTDPRLFSAWPERAMYRPLLLVTYAFNYWVGGYQVLGYHLVNLGLHLGCAILVYLLGTALGGWRGAAVAGALVFALHPAQAETVNYISSRSESLAALGYLGSLLAYVRWRGSGQGRPGGRWLYGLSVLACLAGLLAKSTVIVLPLALLLYEFLAPVRPSGTRRWQVLWPYHLGYWGVSAVYLLIVRNMVAAAVGTPVRPVGVQFLTQVEAAVYYLQLLVMPVRLSVEHQFSAAPGLLAVQVLLPLALLLSGALVLWLRCPLRAWRTCLLLGWAVLALLPSSLVPLNVLVNEHRLYPGIAFLSLALGLLLAPLRSRREWVVLSGLAILLLGVAAHQRNRVWQDEFTLWQDAAAKAPAMYRSHLHLGGALEERGDLPGALNHYLLAVRLAPQAVEAYYDLGNALRLSGRRSEAASAYTRCLELNPGFVPALLNLAGMAVEGKAPDQAEGLLRQVAQVPLSQAQTPALAAVHYNLANLYFDQGEYPSAVRHYEEAIRLQPQAPDPYYNLGDLYLRTGERNRAAAVFAQGVRQAPEGARLLYGLARAQEALDQRQEALASYRRFLPYAGSFPQVRELVQARIQALEQGAP